MKSKGKRLHKKESGGCLPINDARFPGGKIKPFLYVSQKSFSVFEHCVHEMQAKCM